MNFLLSATHGKDVNPELAPSCPPPCVRVHDPGKWHPSTPFLPRPGKADDSRAQSCWAGCWASELCSCTWPGPVRFQACRGSEGVALPFHVVGAAPLPQFTDHALGRQDAGVGGRSWEWHFFHLNSNCLSASPDSRHGFSLKPH